MDLATPVLSLSRCIEDVVAVKAAPDAENEAVISLLRLNRTRDATKL